MESSSIDALIAQGYTRVQAIKIHYQQNLKSQPPKTIEPPAMPSPQPFIREAITRIKSQMNPQIDPLNGAQPRREYGADADDFNSDASRAYAAQTRIVTQQNAEVERKVATLRAMKNNEQVQRKPLNLRPLASIHGRSGFINPTEHDHDHDDYHDEHDDHDEGEEEAVESVQHGDDLQLSSSVPTLSPMGDHHYSPAAPSPGAPSPSESEQFIANLMAQGYKRDEAFLMYLRKVNADKAESRSRLGSRVGNDMSSPAAAAASSSLPMDSPSAAKHIFLDISEPTDKKQEKTFYKFINNALSTESIGVDDTQEVAPGKDQHNHRNGHINGMQSKSNDEAHLAEIQQMKEQQQKLLDELEAQKAQARRLAEEQQQKLREQQEQYERQKQNELIEQKRLIEQLEQQRIQQEQQQRIITQQQEEQKRQLEEQQAQWLAQQKQLQENVLLQQKIFQEQQAEKLREQERKLAEHQQLLQRQHEEKLMEQKGEQVRMLEEIQLAKKLELQLEERERQKQNDMLEQKRLIEQLEQQRIQQEEQHKALLRQQEEQKRLVEEQQRAWVEQQKALQDKLLEQQMQFQRQQAEMQLEQQRKLEEHKVYLQNQQEEKMLEQQREKARIAEEILQAKQREAAIEQARLQREKELMDEQLEKQRLFQERQQQALEQQTRRLQETQEQFLQRQMEEQERQRQEMMEQKLADQTQFQLQQQMLFQQQQQALRLQEQQFDTQSRILEREAVLQAVHSKRSNISDLSDDEDDEPPLASSASIRSRNSLAGAGISPTAGSGAAVTPQPAAAAVPPVQQLNKLDQLRQARGQIQVEDEYDDNHNYLSTSGKMTRGPPIWNTMSPSRMAHKEDNSPYGFNSNKSQQMMMMNLQQQHTPRERLSMGDDDDLSTLSSASHIYSVNNGSAYGAPPPVRRTSLGAEIFSLEDELEIERYMNQGYTREVAVQMFKQRAMEFHNNRGGGSGHRRGDSMNISVTEKDKQRRKSQFTIDQRQQVDDPAANPDHEALKMGLLLSQQEAEYGINMYDSLIPADDPLIEEYLKMGLTMDEAVLKIFEYKFGKVTTLVAEEPSPPRRPTLVKKTSQYGAPVPVRQEEPYRGTPNGHNNGQGYYTSPATSSSNNSASFYNSRSGGGGVPPQGPPAISPASSGSVRSGTRPPMGSSAHGESFYQGMPPPPAAAQPSPYGRGRGDTDSMSISSYGSQYNMRPPPLQQQEYVYPPPRLLTPAQASVDDRALEIAMLLSQQEAQFGVNMYEDLTVQDEGEIRMLQSRGYSSEDATLAVFERKHNVHAMQQQRLPPYSPHAPNGVAGGGYPMSPTARLLTPVRVGAAATPDYQRTTPVMDAHHAPLQRSQSTYVPAPQHPHQMYGGGPPSDYRMPTEYPPQRSQSMYNSNTSSTTPRGGAPAGMMSSNNDSFYGETMRVTHSNSEEQITLAMQQSQLDVRSRPGVERVPGINQASSSASVSGSVSGGGNNRAGSSTPVGRPTSLSSTASSVRVSESDVQQLMSMGFSRDQSVHSLMQNNNNLEVALDRLLTGH